ncbi:MAG: patatin-like phospholipase family protein [Rhodococcus sp. (in: high G+C Gram-positive bacteria)]|uniref:patatin-like phospholipase family protein n=1 Tax=Rhodococcus sp. TaxID=1831 RepID=UPI003BAFA929
MLSSVLDVFRLRQYFNAATRAREWVDGLRDDAGFLTEAGRAAVHLPSGLVHRRELSPFLPRAPYSPGLEAGQRVALAATGGSGAMATIVGAARALEEAGVRPAVISLCSGSAMFGFPLAAGLPSEKVAEFTLGLQPADYIDVDWLRLLALAPTLGRGFAGILRGDAIENAYRRLLGDMTLGEMPIPAYAPIWNVEENRLEYIGPRTHPDLTVARAVHMAIALPLFIQPVEFGGYHWCDGGIVDIFPVHPLLDIEEPCEVTLAVNCFYPPGFEGEDATGWEYRRASILYVASQVRTCQQIELARQNLTRLREASTVVMIEPVPYEKVSGIGFYRQFLSTRDWPGFMRAGRDTARQALLAAGHLPLHRREAP